MSSYRPRRRPWVVAEPDTITGASYPNLAPTLTPTGPDQLWVADLTYLLGLAIAAAEHGRRVYGTLADLITSLEEAQVAGRLQQRLKVLTYPALLVVDEIGYLPVTRTGAMHFYQLMARRYETASTVLTSNKGFEDWGEVFGDDVMAAALIDRLLHHCHVVAVRGNSYRMRHHTDLFPTLTAPQEEDQPQPRRRKSRREAQTA